MKPRVVKWNGGYMCQGSAHSGMVCMQAYGLTIWQAVTTYFERGGDARVGI